MNPEKTDEAIKDRWLHTGDVGVIEANGSLKIIDRVKNIFKLSQGEYIAPEKLENVYVQSKYIQQAWIHGESVKDYLVAFFICDPEVCGKDFNEEEMKQKVYDDMVALAKKKNLNRLELPK